MTVLGWSPLFSGGGERHGEVSSHQEGVDLYYPGVLVIHSPPEDELTLFLTWEGRDTRIGHSGMPVPFGLGIHSSLGLIPSGSHQRPYSGPSHSGGSARILHRPVSSCCPQFITKSVTSQNPQLLVIV